MTLYITQPNNGAFSVHDNWEDAVNALNVFVSAGQEVQAKTMLHAGATRTWNFVYGFSVASITLIPGEYEEVCEEFMEEGIGINDDKTRRNGDGPTLLEVILNPLP